VAEKRIALVTGSSRGIGKSIALRLAESAGCVIVHYGKDRRAALEVVRKIRHRGKAAACFRADLTRENQARSLIRRAEERFGRVDILVNNFGPLLVKRWDRVSAGEWEYVLRANLGSALSCIKAALPGMRARGWGRIVNLGYSRVEHLGAYRDILPYAVAKTGLLLLTRSAAAWAASCGVTVNMVSPGLIEGGVLPADRDVPAGRLGTPEDVAGAVHFLVSDEASYITGANLVVSGGWKTG